MMIFMFSLGIVLAVVDIYKPTTTLLGNVVRRIINLAIGLVLIAIIDKSYLYIDSYSIILGTIIGLAFLLTHIILSKGVKVKREDFNMSMLKTCVLIYLLELPAEEFLYRGMVFLSLYKLTNLKLAVVLSGIIFMLLHAKTWKENKFVIFGSLILGIICCISVYVTHSIWTAVIIHILNDFGFLTLISRRNIFEETP
ncbi:CPBP family intramembrane glutamic endopeptidase [Abyssisolibacter fermentans]|uniref:CPBP family intramembrane glutamic endopeptidase n=1 Tax=Abyssisolibacter fermentans TaxID=1766203 RepID=UPI00082E0064|nr:CPBP family intramembrane glutamic endopeptidase [Abyssisolibacter fermentans]